MGFNSGFKGLKWNFPTCTRDMDGKYIAIKVPTVHQLHLLALISAKCKFCTICVGTQEKKNTGKDISELGPQPSPEN